MFALACSDGDLMVIQGSPTHTSALELNVSEYGSVYVVLALTIQSSTEPSVMGPNMHHCFGHHLAYSRYELADIR
jgi:hypothetical protein